MSSEVLSRFQKRQAIERGLQHFLDPSNLLKTLNYWEEKYSDKPSFVLNRFLSEICLTDQLRLMRKDMLKQVLFELAEVERQVMLARQKIQQKQEKVFVEKPKVVISGSIQDAFFRFVEMVFQQIEEKDLSDFNNEMKQALKEMGLAVSEEAKIHDQEFCEFLPLTSYAKVITSIYECFCDFYGPTKADQCYAKARQLLKDQFPEVDLRQLL